VDPRLIWVLVAIAVIVVAAIVWFDLRRRHSDALRARFGPEYNRAVASSGSITHAEASLEARARRVEALHIRNLAPDDRARYSAAWRRVQERFVDDPSGAVTEADRLVGEVMHARGYPVGDFERRVEDISVDHAGVVMNYRAARDIAEAHARGEATTEDLRQAMVHYRALFDDLLETRTTGTERERDMARGRQ
jgi:hypothetical protein